MHARKASKNSCKLILPTVLVRTLVHRLTCLLNIRSTGGVVVSAAMEAVMSDEDESSVFPWFKKVSALLDLTS